MAAGIGCKCRCLQVPAFIEELWCFDEEAHTFDEEAIQDWDRQMLRDAISAVGNPNSRLLAALVTMPDADVSRATGSGVGTTVGP